MAEEKKEELKKIVKSRIKGLGLDALFHQVELKDKKETLSKGEPVSSEEKTLLERLKRISLSKKESFFSLLLQNIKQSLGLSPSLRSIIKISQDSLKVLKEKRIKDKTIIQEAFYRVIPPLIRKNPQKREEFVKETLKEFLSPQEDRFITVIIPRQKVIMKFLTLPTAEEREIEKMLEFEIKEIIPLPVSEIEFDYQIIEKEENKTHLILVGIKKQDILDYLSFLEKAEVNPSRIEVSSLSLYNFLKPNLNKEENLLQVNIANSYTDLNIIRRGRLLFSRSLNIGSESLTLNLAKNLNLSLDNAEKIKKENGIILSQKEKNPTAQEISKIACQWADSLIEEIEKTLTYLKLKENERIEIDKLILSGGGSRLINLPDYLKEKLKLRVNFSKIPDYIELPNPQTAQNYEKYFLEFVELSYPFLKDKKKLIDINLLPQKLRKALKTRLTKIKILIFSSFFLLLILSLSLVASFIIHNKEKTLTQKEEILKRLSKEIEELKLFKQRIRNIQAYISPEKSCMEVLREISLLAGPDIIINKFSFEKDNLVILDGEASSHSSVVKFSKDLGESKIFKASQIKYTKRKERIREEVIFEIICKLR